MPYRDYDGFPYRYWRGIDCPNGAHDAGFSEYDDTTDRFADYAAELAEYADPDDSILVVACALGHTVRELQAMGYETMGVDVSRWAVDNAVTTGVECGDITNRDIIKSVPHVDVVYSECVLSCLTDEEAATACNNMRALGDEVIHRLWSFPEVNDHEWYNVKTESEWQATVDPTQQDRWL